MSLFKKIVFFLFSLAIGVWALHLVLYQIGGWQEVVRPLSFINGWQAVVIFIFSIFFILLDAYRLQLILADRGISLPFSQTKEIFLGGFTLSYLSPSALFGGEPFMIFALRRALNMPWSKSIASLVILKVLGLTSILLFLIVGTVGFLHLTDLPLNQIAIIGGSVTAGLSFILLLFYFYLFGKKKILSRLVYWLTKNYSKRKPLLITEIEKEIFSFFRWQNLRFWQCLGLTILVAFSQIIRFWFIIVFLGIKTGFLAILAIYGFINVAYALPLPAALGSAEASQAFVFDALGLGAAGGTAFALILRGAELSLCFFGLFFVVKWGVQIFLYRNL